MSRDGARSLEQRTLRHPTPPRELKLDASGPRSCNETVNEAARTSQSPRRAAAADIAWPFAPRAAEPPEGSDALIISHYYLRRISSNRITGRRLVPDRATLRDCGGPKGVR